ncbi:pyrophosphate-energized vacuolar membrane proton pump-like protein [Tanacetum coccineum]
MVKLKEVEEEGYDKTSDNPVSEIQKKEKLEIGMMVRHYQVDYGGFQFQFKHACIRERTDVVDAAGNTIANVTADALGMLGTIATGVAIDAYGPICDNAQCIAEMADMSHIIREKTDVVDAAGNTIADVTGLIHEDLLDPAMKGRKVLDQGR